MIRRDFLSFVMFTASVAVLSGRSKAASVSMASPASRVIFDGRFRQARILAARALASGAAAAFDCRSDAAALWYGKFAGRVEPAWQITGITSAADAMIIADCARRDGLQLVRGDAPMANGLIVWSIAHKRARGEKSRT